MILSSLTNEELIKLADSNEKTTPLEQELAVRLALAIDALADLEQGK